jgi:hypothetical protein
MNLLGLWRKRFIVLSEFGYGTLQDLKFLVHQQIVFETEKHEMLKDRVQMPDRFHFFDGLQVSVIHYRKNAKHALIDIANVLQEVVGEL